MVGIGGETANLIVALRLDDSGFSGKLARANAGISGFGRGLSQMGRGVGQVGTGIGKILDRLALVTVGLGAAAVTTAVSYEDAFAGVRKTVEASDADLLKLRDSFRAMSREIPLAFEEFAAIGEAAGALGIGFDKVTGVTSLKAIEEFTRVVALLGVTTDLSADQAATSLGVLSNVLGLTQDDYDNFGAALVDLGNKGASTESQIITIAERAGASANLIGIAKDATLGWAAAVANLGIESEAGGSALQRFFIESLRMIESGGDELAIFAETAGVSAKAFRDAFRDDSSAALEDFIIGLGKLTQAERLAVLEALGFNDIRISRTLLGLTNDTDQLSDALDVSAEAWKANTALTVEAEKRFATTASMIAKLKNNLRDVGFTIGSELLPVANELITDFLGELNKPGTQKGIRDFATGLAEGVRTLVKELKSTDFSGILAGLRLTADVAKGAFDAFRALPGPIQQLAIAALVANKVSGGAVGDIARGLGNIFVGAVKTMLAASLAPVLGQLGLGKLLQPGRTAANPLYVWVVNNLPGSGPGPPVPPILNPRNLLSFVGPTVLAALAFLGSRETSLNTNEWAGLEPDQNFLDFWNAPWDEAAEGVEKLAAATAAFTPLGQFNPANPGGVQPPKTPADLFGVLPPMLVTALTLALNPKPLPDTAFTLTELPDTAVTEVDITSLPNTAMGALTDTSQGVEALPPILNPIRPILTATQREVALASQRAAELRTAADRGFTRSEGLLGTIARKPDPRVDVEANVTVNTFVSGTMVQRQQSQVRIARGGTGGFLETV